jgi:transcription termination factor Rho
LKRKTPAELLAFAEELQIENASSLRKQDMLFAILKQLAENDVPISGDGVLEVLSDGFGFLRSAEANYLAGPDDIYVSPSQVRRFGLRTGDTVEGQIRSPRDGERYFGLCHGNERGMERGQGLIGSYAGVTASDHCAAASALKIRSVDREMRWR